MKKELRELDFSHWMPSFVKIKGRDVDGKNASTDDDLLSSDESVFELLDSKDPDESSDDNAKSLSPEEIVVSSDEAEVEEKMPNTAQPVDSDVSILSDAMEFLQETSSESDEEDNQPLNYEEKFKKYHSYTHYTCLKGHIMRKRLPSPVTSIKEIFMDADTVDEIAKFFYPFDGPVGYLPIVTGSDGNCLPRALSHLFFGNEDHHFKVRCRIIEAGVLNENDFISHQILTWGVTNGSKNWPQQYTMYSPQLQPIHRRLDRDEILDINQWGLMALTNNFEFMGIWQIHQAAEAFRRPIGSVFPYTANISLWADLNRMILPLNASFDNMQPVHVQWTPLHKDHHASNVKHFVSLMKPLSTVSIVSHKQFLINIVDYKYKCFFVLLSDMMEMLRTRYLSEDFKRKSMTKDLP